MTARRPGRRLAAFVAALGAIVLVAGCAGSSKPKPQPLEALTPKIGGSVAWSQHIEAVQFPLAVAVTKGVFTVAGNDGTVLALDADTGREVWRGDGAVRHR